MTYYRNISIKDLFILQMIFKKERRNRMKKYDLSDLELEVMDYIWSHKEGVLFKDLVQHFITEQGKEWKRQSLRTFLLRLEEKGFLRIEQTARRSYIYIATQTKQQYVQKWTKNLLNEMYSSSLKNFVCALTGGEKLSKKEIEELKDMIEE